MENGKLSFICDEPEGKVERFVTPAELSFATLSSYYDNLKRFKTVFNSYIENNLDEFIKLFVQGDGDSVKATGLLWEVDDVGILYLTEIALGHDALAHFNFWDRRFKGREGLIRGMLVHVMDTFELHRVTVEVGTFAGGWLPNAVERIGFKKEGRKREAIMFEGIWYDSLLYSILRSEVNTDGSLVGGKDGS